MNKKICKIGAQIHYIKDKIEEVDELISDLVKEIINDNPEEMNKIIGELIKESIDELL